MSLTMRHMPLITVDGPSMEPTPSFLSRLPDLTEVNRARRLSPLIAVIGVGFVGTGLVGSFSSCYEVLGFDVSEKRVHEAGDEFQGHPTVSFTTQEARLKEANVFLVSVPTLLRKNKSIDLSYLQSAISVIEKHAEPGSTVVIESSVAVGNTRQLLGPIMRSRRLFGGMSPERIDPGRTEPPMHTIPKIVSGLDDIVPGSLEAITRIYSRVFDTLVPVSSPEVAEMTKLYENSQRMVCIAYANEMANVCGHLGIDAFEVANAAATKPFGYLPCSPGLGVGGHCIPVNPHYLFSCGDFPLLKKATGMMRKRPTLIARQLAQHLSMPSLKRTGVLSRKGGVLVVGLGFKAGQSHLVNSPGVQLAEEVQRLGVKTMFADTLVSQEALPNIPRLDDKDWTVEELSQFDAILVCFKHDSLKLEVLDTLRGVTVFKWYR